MALTTYTPPDDRIVHRTEVDFVDRVFLGTPVHIVQGDNSLPVVAVKMYKMGQPYCVPDTASGNIRWKKPRPSKYFVYNPFLGFDSEDNSVAYFEVTSQMTTESGPVHAILEILVGENEDKAGSGPLQILIDRNPIQEDDLEDTNELKTLKGYVEDAKESASNSAESARISDENAKKSAKSEANAAKSEEQAKEYSGNPPIIQNGTWWIWDATEKQYKDTGARALLIDENGGDQVKMWFGTVGEYNALPVIHPDIYYNILEGEP